MQIAIAPCRPEQLPGALATCRQVKLQGGAYSRILYFRQGVDVDAHFLGGEDPFAHPLVPYRGCEHGCIYCYARPSHAYLDLSPGLDFESKLFAKANAAELLRVELSKPGYRPEMISIGANTDPYQPIERKWQITRQIIQVLAQCNHPLSSPSDLAADPPALWEEQRMGIA